MSERPARKSVLRALRTRLDDWLRPVDRISPERSSLRVDVSCPSRYPEGLEGIVEAFHEDVEAVLTHDPAARTKLEVVLVYPGVHALWMHRASHHFWRQGHVLGPRLLSHVNRWMTGIEIHPGAKIGRRVFIDHGMGIVIGETATVGDECLLYKGVVLGGTSLARKERHPTLGKGVVVGSNACILGAIQVGDGVRVGSGSVVVRDVPAEATVVGIPGRITEKGAADVRAQLDHAALPDPVANVLSSLIEEVEALRREVARLRGDSVQRPAGRDREDDDFDEGDKRAVEGE